MTGYYKRNMPYICVSSQTWAADVNPAAYSVDIGFAITRKSPQDPTSARTSKLFTELAYWLKSEGSEHELFPVTRKLKKFLFKSTPPRSLRALNRNKPPSIG